MSEVDNEARAFVYAETLLGVAIDIVGAANVQITERGAQDPGIIALALLCRSITNFKGAMVMLRERQIVEARTLVRCCYENLLVIAALRERGADFVKDMQNDEAANRKSLGETVLRITSREGANLDDGIGRKLRGHIRTLNKRFPNSRKLKTSKTAAQGVVDLAYGSFLTLSHDAVHPSLTALHRHLRSFRENDAAILQLDVVPQVAPAELLGTIRSACEALVGVSVTANELVGHTTVSDRLRATFDEFDALFPIPTVRGTTVS